MQSSTPRIGPFRGAHPKDLPFKRKTRSHRIASRGEESRTGRRRPAAARAMTESEPPLPPPSAQKAIDVETFDDRRRLGGPRPPRRGAQGAVSMLFSSDSVRRDRCQDCRAKERSASPLSEPATAGGERAARRRSLDRRPPSNSGGGGRSRGRAPPSFLARSPHGDSRFAGLRSFSSYLSVRHGERSERKRKGGGE